VSRPRRGATDGRQSADRPDGRSPSIDTPSRVGRPGGLADGRERVPTAGRPRDADLDARVLAATRDLLAERGYAGTNLAAVARMAATTRPTIYLRWSSKEDLVTAAIAAMPLPSPLPVTTDVRSDLLAELRHFHAAVTRPHGINLVGTVLAEEHTTPALLDHFRRRLLAPRRARVEGILHRGVKDGTLRADLDLDAATNLLIGSFYGRYLATSTVPADWPERTLATVWTGWLSDGSPPG
jgi:AcrR family transcriptional regulator